MRVMVTSKRRQAGFSMLEMALSVCLAGIFLVLFWGISQSKQQQSNQARSAELISRADQAISGFMFVQGRLVCPAIDDAGVESCTGANSGYLPWKTLGLPDARAGKIQYTENSYPVKTGANVDLTQSSEHLQVLAFQNSSVGASLVSARSTTANVDATSYRYFDLCSILSSPVSASTALVPAYILANGDGGVIVRDSVLNRSFAELSVRLGCPGMVAVGARAYFNALLAANTLLQSLQDYNVQLGLDVTMAMADVLSGAQALTMVPLKLAIKVNNLDNANGKCLSELDCSDVALATVDEAITVTNSVISLVKQGRFAVNLVAATDNASEASAQIALLVTLQAGMKARAEQSVAAGAYLE